MNFVYFILLLGLFFQSISAHAAMPDLSSEKKKFNSLTRVWAAVPGIFEDSISYPIPLMKLLAEEDRLLTELKKNPEFVRLVESRTQYLRFDIETKEAVTRKRTEIDSTAIEHWRSLLRKQIKNVVESGKEEEWQWQNELKARLTDRIKGLPAFQIEAMRTSLIVSLVSDADRRRALLALPNEEQNRFLQSLERELLPAKFQGQRYGLKPGSSIGEALKAMNTFQTFHEGMSLDLILHSVMGTLNQRAGRSLSSDEALERLELLQGQDLLFFADPDTIKEKVVEIAKADPKDRGLRERARLLENTLEKNYAFYLTQKREIEERTQESLRVIEVPIEIALFRGCVGGDCSSRLSFPYPNDPNEKVFFIFGKDGKPKG